MRREQLPPALRLGGGGVLADPREAKVGDAEGEVGGEEEVLRLQVAVHHPGIVAVLQPPHQLLEVPERND